MLIKLKKAAMFGLDARIALAIFGALSVISGAALYSAIQNAKVIAFITEMKELGKAVEAYMLDTGKNLPLLKTDGSDNKTGIYGELVTSAEDNWKGPYFPMPVDGVNTHRYDHSLYGGTHLYYMQPYQIWGEDTTWSSAAFQLLACGQSSFVGKCGIWAFTSYVPKNISKSLDDYVDGGDGGKNGNLRYFYPTGTASDAEWHVFYNVMQKM